MDVQCYSYYEFINIVIDNWNAIFLFTEKNCCYFSQYLGVGMLSRRIITWELLHWIKPCTLKKPIIQILMTINNIIHDSTTKMRSNRTKKQQKSRFMTQILSHRTNGKKQAQSTVIYESLKRIRIDKKYE